MTAFRSSLLVITMLFSLSALAQKDTIIINRGKTIYTKVDTFKIGNDPSNIERIIVIKGDSLIGNKTDSFVLKTDKIVMGKTTILTKTDTVGGKQQKTVEISVSGEGLGEMIEKQIDFFTNRDKKPGKKVEGFDLFKTEKLVEGFDLFKTEKKKELKNVENFWWVLDLGFSGYNDQSNYALARTTGFVAPNIGKDQLKLNMTGSRNVNLWILMQRVNLAKHMLNLKYGVGLEMNNYRFAQENLQFQKNPTAIYLGMVEYNKVKLAADYITVPMMLNLNTSPEKSNGLRLSVGVSAGFLYSSRFKTKEGGDIDKLRSDFDLEPFKLSWVGELGLGPITLYSSFAMNNMWNKGLDMRPYNVGIRLGARPEKAKTKTITATKKPSSFNWSEKL
ncbi:MAG: outer membrane beta-barrel protein [Bacteroidetes bacterium]|nr:outer membrane beta-barrel protein [Bacteroidota bacterium]